MDRFVLELRVGQGGAGEKVGGMEGVIQVKVLGDLFSPSLRRLCWFERWLDEGTVSV